MIGHMDRESPDLLKVSSLLLTFCLFILVVLFSLIWAQEKPFLLYTLLIFSWVYTLSLNALLLLR